MINELALNAALGMERIYIVLLWDIQGHYCILRNPCHAYFDS